MTNRNTHASETPNYLAHGQSTGVVAELLPKKSLLCGCTDETECFDHKLPANEPSDLMCQTCRGKGQYAGLDVTCRSCRGSGLEPKQSAEQIAVAAMDEREIEEMPYHGKFESKMRGEDEFSEEFQREMRAELLPTESQRVAELREAEILAMAQHIIDNDQFRQAGSVVMWRDVLCRECETNTCDLGTARKLAEKAIKEGWMMSHGEPLCPKCQQI